MHNIEEAIDQFIPVIQLQQKRSTPYTRSGLNKYTKAYFKQLD